MRYETLNSAGAVEDINQAEIRYGHPLPDDLAARFVTAAREAIRQRRECATEVGGPPLDEIGDPAGGDIDVWVEGWRGMPLPWPVFVRIGNAVVDFYPGSSQKTENKAR